MLISTTRLISTAVLISVTSAQYTLNGVNYPELDVPPSTNTAWSSRFLTGNIPNIPVNPQQLANPDWTNDITKCSNPTSWGLTYDDGPSQYTLDLLQQLSQRNLKATFFVVGSRVVENPTILQQVYSAGHQIAIHTWSHTALTTQTNDQIIAEIMWTAQIIKQVIGVTPKFFRPPYGDIDDRVRQVLKNMGIVPILWSLDSGDGAGSTTVADTVQQQISAGGSGFISLEHDLFQQAEEQAPDVMDEILAAGFKPGRMDACVNYPAYDEGLLATSSMTATGKSNPSLNSTTSSFNSTAPRPSGMSRYNPNGVQVQLASNSAFEPSRISQLLVAIITLIVLHI